MILDIPTSAWLIDICHKATKTYGLRSLLRNFMPDIIEKYGGKAVLKHKAIFQLKGIMSNYDLVNIWRVHNPTLRQFTW